MWPGWCVWHPCPMDLVCRRGACRLVITLQPLCLLYSQHALALSVCAGVNVLDGVAHAPFPAMLTLCISPHTPIMLATVVKGVWL